MVRPFQRDDGGGETVLNSVEETFLCLTGLVGPVECWAFSRLPRIWAAEDMGGSVPDGHWLAGWLAEDDPDEAGSFSQGYVDVEDAEAADKATEVGAHPEVREFRRVHRDVVSAPGALPGHEDEAVGEFGGEEDEAEVEDDLVPALEADDDF